MLYITSWFITVQSDDGLDTGETCNSFFFKLKNKHQLRLNEFVIVVQVQEQTPCHNMKHYNIKVAILKYGGLYGEGFAM